MFLAQATGLISGAGLDSTAVHAWIGQIFPGIDPQIQALIAGLAAAWVLALLGKLFNWVNPKLASGKGAVVNVLGVITALWVQWRWILNPILASLLGKLTGGNFVIGLLGYGAQKTLVNAGSAIIRKGPDAVRKGGVAIVLGVLLASLLYSSAFAATGKTAAADNNKAGFTSSLLAFPASLLKDNVYSIGAGERYDNFGVWNWGDWAPKSVWVVRVTHVFTNHLNAQAEYERQFKQENPYKSLRVLGVLYF
jgi:hypothetical protein